MNGDPLGTTTLPACEASIERLAGGIMDRPADAGQKAGLTDYLAVERTLLAWIRTGLALMGFGFVVARFGLFLQQLQFMQHVSSEQSYGLSLWFGTALIAVGVIVNIFSGWHHVRLVRELDHGETSHSRPTAQAVAISFFWHWSGWQWRSISFRSEIPLVHSLGAARR